MKTVINIILATILLCAMTFYALLHINFNQDCKGYLALAANANTVESALTQLQIATNYLEEKGMTNGYTSVLWRTPSEDIGFWYNNLKSAQAELMKVNENTSQLERTNILLKLRETLVSHGEKGDYVVVPKGLSRYPNNLFWGVCAWLSFFFVVGIVIRFLK